MIGIDELSKRYDEGRDLWTGVCRICGLMECEHTKVKIAPFSYHGVPRATSANKPLADTEKETSEFWEEECDEDDDF